uniref:SWAP70 N-terminal EF-hand domain-containing protein n=1 Tax=Lepisosteus oculatus TaxID=7918 RepID=W5NDA4_LEPOC
MNFKAELLKSIWYAFTSLDVEQSGKVSKSQLKVLSHNLYTALNIPHDPVALEEHFRDDDAGPVSNQGYMPYLNNYILAKAREGTFNKEAFDDLCWMMTSKKNYDTNKLGILSSRDCFRLFCLFNLLSEDTYPLVMIPDEARQTVSLVTSRHKRSWSKLFLNFHISLTPDDQKEAQCIPAFINTASFPKLLAAESKAPASSASRQVVPEYLKQPSCWSSEAYRANIKTNPGILKQALSLLSPGDGLHWRAETKQKRLSCVGGEVETDSGPDASTATKEAAAGFQCDASSRPPAIQTAVRLQAEGKTSLHRELKLRRREQRQQSPHAREEPPGLQVLQEERGRQELEQEQLVRRQQEQERRLQEEQERKRQLEVQRSLERQLEEAERVRESMAAEIARKEQEARGQRRRIEELELTQQSLERALNAEIQARLEEETARLEQERLLSQEEEKLQHLSLLKQEQDLLLQQAQLERSMLEAEVADKVQAFETASQELQRLRESRERSNHDLQVAQKKLRRASRHVKHWNVQLNRLMQPIAPGGVQDGELISESTLTETRGALSSKEFIARRCPGNMPVSECSSSSEDEGLEEDLQKISLSGANRRRMEPNGQE